MTKVAAMYGRNNLVRIILQDLTIPSKTGPMKRIQKKRKSLKDTLIDLFNKPIEVKSIITTKAPVKGKGKSRNKSKKTVHSKSTAKLKEKLKAESLARAEAEKRLKAEIKAREKAEASLKAKSKIRQGLQAKEVKVEDDVEAEEKIRACAKEIRDCIEMINKSSSGTEGKPNRDSEHADMDNIDSKAGGDARKYKATGGKDVDKGTKSSRQSVPPAEMVTLVAKAEENLSKAVIKAKEKDDKKAKRAK